MTNLYIATGDALVVVAHRGGRWEAEVHMVQLPTQCVAADPARGERVYCGTFGRGLWTTSDGGDSWRPAGDGIAHAQVMAVAVSSLERAGADGVVWAGTEPSALFRSEDGGRAWQERPSLRALPSASTWSFPPRPWTHHVRWISPDPTVAGRVFVAIELGGVMRSVDSGLTWEDRKPGAQHDAHTLATHPRAPGLICEAAGGGYAVSRTGGAAWAPDDDGLGCGYLWGLAVDPGDPYTAVVSAAPGPRQAHHPEHAYSTVYRKSAGGAWQEVCLGLPERRGRRVVTLAAHAAEPGVFYAAVQEGALYRSEDAGASWGRLDVKWPGGYRFHQVHGLAVAAA
jgi:hypothetical protein